MDTYYVRRNKFPLEELYLKLVKLSKGKKIVGYKWEFMKFHSNRTIERNKVTIVAKGYAQTYEIYYQATFTPVTKINVVRVILSIIVNLNWPSLQFDYNSM